MSAQPEKAGEGAERLRRSLRRLGRAWRTRRQAAQPPGAALDGGTPRTPWERQTEQRLRAIEHQLASQNRLLLITIITIVGETLYKVTVR